MKSKSVDKVISDLRDLFGISELGKNETWKEGLHELKGKFFIYKERFKRKKVDKMLKHYFSKVEISDGYFEKLEKSMAYSIFKIHRNESKKEKGKEKQGKGKKGKKNKKNR